MKSKWWNGWMSILFLLLTIQLTTSQIYEGECQLDLFFLVDSSLSVPEGDFRTILRSILTYLADKPVAPEAVNVGVISFSSTLDILPLTGDIDVINSTIPTMAYGAMRTYTDMAFQMARNLFLSNSRPDAPRVVILFTDGPATYQAEAAEEAELLRNIGVTIYAIGIGTNPPVQQLSEFTGNNNDQLAAVSALGALNIVMNVVIDLPLRCEVIYPPPTTTIVDSFTSTTSLNERLTTTSTVNDGFTSTTSLNERLTTTSTVNDGFTPTTSLNERLTTTSTVNDGLTSTSLNLNNELTPTPTTTAVSLQPTTDSERVESLSMGPSDTRDASHRELSTSLSINPTSDPGHTENLDFTTIVTLPLPTVTTTTHWSNTDIDIESINPSIAITPTQTQQIRSSSLEPRPPVHYTELLCARSREMDGQWLTSHPKECDKFIQCHYAEDGQLTTAVRLCPRGLFFSKAKSTCVDPLDASCEMDPCQRGGIRSYKMDGGCGLYWRCVKGVSVGESCIKGRAFTSLEGCILSYECRTISIPDGDTMCESEGLCQRVPLPSNRAYRAKLSSFPGDWVTTPCLFGASFDVASCSCVASRPFQSSCHEHIKMIERNQTENISDEKSTRLIFDSQSSRPIALLFRYKPLPSNNHNDKQAEILLRSSECSGGGLFVLWEESNYLEARIFAKDGYYMKASLPLIGLNSTDWRTVKMRYTFSGDLTLKLISGDLTFTTHIQGGLYVPISLCGWVAGLPGSLAEQMSPFTGSMEEIYISRCYDHGF